MAINLFFNYFSHPDPERKKEIDKAFELNKNNPYFKRIINLNTGMGRPSYEDFFNLMANYPQDANVLCNSDIYFDETIQNAENIGSMDAFCLTRWELVGDEVVSFEKRHGIRGRFSQDAWIFRGRPKIDPVYFGMGQPGCDNKIAYLLKSQGYNVRNARMKIRAIHIHQNAWRDPGRDYMKVSPPYYFPEPEPLNLVIK